MMATSDVDEDEVLLEKKIKELLNQHPLEEKAGKLYCQNVHSLSRNSDF